jgi:hypothetical protein
MTMAGGIPAKRLSPRLPSDAEETAGGSKIKRLHD